MTLLKHLAITFEMILYRTLQRLIGLYCVICSGLPILEIRTMIVSFHLWYYLVIDCIKNLLSQFIPPYMPAFFEENCMQTVWPRSFQIPNGEQHFFNLLYRLLLHQSNIHIVSDFRYNFIYHLRVQFIYLRREQFCKVT